MSIYINGYNREKVITKILKENNGYRSILKREGKIAGCAYRSADGNKCFAGCFIPDQLYKAEFEGCNIQHIINENQILRPFMPVSCLLDLQQIHDNADGGTKFTHQWLNTELEKLEALCQK